MNDNTLPYNIHRRRSATSPMQWDKMITEKNTPNTTRACASMHNSKDILMQYDQNATSSTHAALTTITHLAYGFHNPCTRCRNKQSEI